MRVLPANKQKRELWTFLILFLLLLFCSTYTFPRWADWNQNSRFDLVLAIVDQGTLCIDDYYQNTDDNTEPFQNLFHWIPPLFVDFWNVASDGSYCIGDGTSGQSAKRPILNSFLIFLR